MDKTVEQAELLPCPFCGAGPAKPEGRFTNASFSGVELMTDPVLAYFWCGTCGAQSRHCETASEAFAAWNTRSTSDLRAKAEGLEAQVMGVLYMLAEAPEINPANYTDDDVCEQNRVLNEAHASLRAILAKHGEQSQ